MPTYLVGDIHGCFTELQSLLAQVSFRPQIDRLWLTGDLVARGPNSLEVLRLIRSLGPAARLVLGNHDLNLISIYGNSNLQTSKSCMRTLLEAPDSDELISWLRLQPMLQVDDELKLVMAHAGITPQWDLDTAKICAREVESVLRNNTNLPLFDIMYGDMPSAWSPKLSGLPRLRFSINALTRMRYCYSDGRLDMTYKNPSEAVDSRLKPWFDFPRLVDSAYTVIFGHWASLEGTRTPLGIIGLDTGCCWGGKLTMLRWEDRRYFTQIARIVRPGA